MSNFFSCCVAFFCLHAYSEQILISEIFGNSAGKGRDQGKEWIELANVSHDVMLVKSLTLEIYTGKNEDLTFTKNMTLPEPILFFDYLLIAQTKDLGLARCLKDDIPIILMPELTIKNDSKHKICVVINAHKSCAKISKKAKMIDGVSLFRELSDVNEHPLWRNEPCHLIDEVFASPGMPSRFCAHEQNAMELFRKCQEENEPAFDVVVDRIDVPLNPSSKISLNDVEISGDKRKELTFSLKDEKEEFWLMSLCAAPRDSKKICHLLFEPQGISSKKMVTSYVGFWPQNMGEDLLLHVSNMAGIRAQFNLDVSDFNKSVKSHAPWRPQFLLQSKEQDLSIRLLLRPEELPLNLSLITDTGEIVMQRSFLTEGEKICDFSIDKKQPPAFLQFAGSLGTIRVPLVETANKSSPNGCQHSDQSSIIILAVVWFLLRKSS